MIDLSVNQIVDPPVRCWVSYAYNKDAYRERMLIRIGRHCDGTMYYITKNTDNEQGYYEHCTLTDPTKKFKKWLTVEDVPVELWCNALFKTDEEPTYCAEVMSPNKCTDCDGKLFTDLVYLPLGQPLTGEWLPFESEE